MILKEIIIQNYRKFSTQEDELGISFTLDDDITLLAGANNSGKTSLIDLLQGIIGDKHGYSVSDIPVTKAKEWIDRAYPVFTECFDANTDKNQTIKAIVDKLFSLESPNPEPSILIPPTVIKFRVDYKKEDDFRNFADYLMDLNSDNKSFYFLYTFRSTPTSLGQALENDYDKLKSRYAKIADTETEIAKVEFLKEKILLTYASSIVAQCFYTDSAYENQHKMELPDFRKLFNFKNIHAGRTLDDQNTGRDRKLSKNMIDLACCDESWMTLIADLPDKILRPIEEAEIKQTVRNTSLDGLSEALETISTANGGNTGEMILNLDISEETISNLINQILNAKYQLEGYFLSEASQGLGYSNMIYILLQLETYVRNRNPFLVNIFVIEEPESHMHPQMQNVFGKYICKYYQEKQIQGIITTHSSEMVRVTDMKKLRVARSLSSFDSKIFDFSSFISSVEQTDEQAVSDESDEQTVSDESVLSNFYDWFYEIGFSDIVFADRIILYEGDTERLLIRKLATISDYQDLNRLYIAFVQVGGAYAYNYREIIEFLGIKTLILTDLDYDKAADSEDSIKMSWTTNSAIKNFYGINHPNVCPTVLGLYDWANNKGNILFNDCVYVCYQGASDNFARTLEEAILAKHYVIRAFDTKSREDWKKLRAQDHLKYTIPRDPGNYSLRDIVAHTSNGKTDFMYSVILNKLLQDMLPEYIKEGLEWLMQ
jgi:predicted ATP-dependent endonuclease of OLD family